MQRVKYMSNFSRSLSLTAFLSDSPFSLSVSVYLSDHQIVREEIFTPLSRVAPM